MPDVELRDDGALVVRSYTLAKKSDRHSYNQIAIPLNGVLDISIEGPFHRVGVGQAAIIVAGKIHRYSAEENSRFLVANMAHLPENAAASANPVVEIDKELMIFCNYADAQLKSSSDDATGVLLYSLFCKLLEAQTFASRTDPRVLRALQLIEEDLGVSHPVETLANVAHLSASQFKNLFKVYLGQSTRDYIATRRMERAKTLLRNTDYPISVVAVDVGYDDASAFTRRFRKHFGQSPKEFARNRKIPFQQHNS
ncbi:AraC family transcriptional regulator [uncultured Roseobacter sp.]|uniref:helix-turn-helix domain-containing protein n=1 Tax=uncultured Roseobacter sp. TaxID=114847 RepID=UPI002609CBC5|nr:AraC family transcriptional regulator [uncultured Roseobacter sp.]